MFDASNQHWKEAIDDVVEEFGTDHRAAAEELAYRHKLVEKLLEVGHL